MAKALRLTFKSCESPCFLHCGNDGTQDQQAESRKNKKRIFQVVFKFLVNPIYIPTPTVGLFNPSLATVRHGIEQLEPAEDRGQFSWKESKAHHKSIVQLETVLQFLSIGHKKTLACHHQAFSLQIK